MTPCVMRDTKDRYPRIWLAAEGRVVREHRYVYERKYGPIPKGKVVRHLCGNSRCANVKHLTVGTQRQNLYDGKRKYTHGCPGVYWMKARPTQRGYWYVSFWVKGKMRYFYHGYDHTEACRVAKTFLESQGIRSGRTR